MGNDNKKEQPLPHPQSDLKINHQKFHFFTYHQPEDLIQIVLQAQSERDIKHWWEDELKLVSTFEDKETLLLPKKYQYHSRGFCGNVGSAKIYYENFPYLFEQEIENRIDNFKHFTEEELWYLLYSLVSSARDFSKLNSKIGDVRPYNIFINEEGQIKIANIFSWPYEKTNFEKTAFEKQLTFISPEELRLIAKGNHENSTNKILSQSFSIGLTLLQSGLLFNVKQLYSIQHYSFDLDKLNQKLNEWQRLQFVGEDNNYHTYSPLMRNIVTSLCHPDDKERISSLKIQDLLRPYQIQILNLKEFDHRNIQLPLQGITQQPIQTNGQQIQQNIQQGQPNIQHVQPIQTNIQQVQQVQHGQPIQPLPFQNYNKKPVAVIRSQPIQTIPSPPNIITFPQQTIKVNNPLQPKYNTQQFPSQFNTNPNVQTSVRFTKTDNIVIANDNYAQEQFHKNVINHSNEVNFRPQSHPSQGFEPQFYKYTYNQSNTTTMPSATLPHSISIPQNYTTLQQTSSQPTFNPPPQFNPPIYSAQPYSSQSFNPNTYSSINHTAYTNAQFSRPMTTTVQSTNQSNSMAFGSTTGDSSDFLRKIDEQLQSSRRQFPS